MSNEYALTRFPARLHEAVYTGVLRFGFGSSTGADLPPPKTGGSHRQCYPQFLTCTLLLALRDV